MAKQKVEKLGKIVGKNRPLLGGVLLLVSAIWLVAVLGYSAGQEVLFKHIFEPLLPSTESAGNNICGKFGATISMLSMLLFGATAYMLPVYLLWIGIACFKLRAVVVSKTEVLAMIFGGLSLSILASVFQDFLGDSAPLQSATFPSGWGGKFGFVIYAKLKPLLDILGTALIFGGIYFLTLVIIFVDSPAEAAVELWNAIKWCFKKLGQLLLAILISFWRLPKNLVVSIFSRKKDDEEETLVVDGEKKLKKQKQPVEDESEFIEPEQATIKEIDLSDLERFAKELGEAEVSETTTDVVVASVSQTGTVEAEEETPADLPVIEELPKAKIEEIKQEQPVEILPPEIVKTPETQIAESLQKPKPKKKTKYIFPNLNLLNAPVESGKTPAEEEHEQRQEALVRMTEIVNAIGSFGVKVKPDKVYPGPVITRYDVTPDEGVRVSRIASLEDDIILKIRARSIRMIAPVPGLGTVGVEVPNKSPKMVTMREVLRSREWRDNKYEIPVALGKDATGIPIVANLKKMTHALIAGSTNSGKSVCINTIIVSMLYKMSPEDLRLIMIDPKMVELQGYNSIPHMLIPVVSDVKKAAAALKWLVGEMMRRYQIFQASGVRNIDGFNAKILKDKSEMARADEEFAQMSAEERQAALSAQSEATSASSVEVPEEKLPYIVCIIDELADLMSVVGKDVEIYIARITQLARAAGIHMIIATQRPDVKVITGKIKNNLPTRIAFRVTSQIDSRTILDRKGAETLIGQGDMLFANNGSPDLVRAQGAYLSDEEIASVVEALKVNGEPQYAEEVQAALDASDDEDSDEIGEGEGGKYGDPVTAKAIMVIKASGKASTSLLQRKLGIGYGRAARIIDDLETRGLIGPDQGGGKRDLFLD